VWHDDQQGTATVVLAALINAATVVNKRLEEMRIVLIGAGAASTAVYRLFLRFGIPSSAFIICDSGARSTVDVPTLRRAKRFFQRNGDCARKPMRITSLEASGQLSAAPTSASPFHSQAPV
jgi:malic enzyme